MDRVSFRAALATERRRFPSVTFRVGIMNLDSTQPVPEISPARPPSSFHFNAARFQFRLIGTPMISDEVILTTLAELENSTPYPRQTPIKNV